MARVSDAIEAYLRHELARSPDGVLVIQRAVLAERFDCVPSQITYVLMTRFTPERGYVVEGRRGGGGGIRLVQLKTSPADVLGSLAEADGIDQAAAEAVVARVTEAGYLTAREAHIIQAALDREVLAVQLPERDRLRARLLRAMLTEALRPEGAYDP
ncbi:transcriptional regulator of class III stress genes [Candidatus Hydrogenisulfobacillus filiaventi]|uniref:Transcriptional regulator of class III stress genes n=1 Tax=Candidatus Hydrogenisulfobacillus filiaventi TaxID=2707344 RepID=A0A6F8ZKK7_9FIRM|nr:CtsR family transcriptional regulator [Bacillota bacterium]CAB1129995.1 transcriptional regulator of class III stress genes [Candidatus Hydrogenisulfobacillus filiaventi]